MRKLNVRFFLVLVGVVSALAVGLFLIHLFQEDRIAAAQLWQAESARQAEKWDKAAAHYERYLEFKPEDAAVMLAYAEMIEQRMDKQSPGARNPRKVVFLLEEVLKREPDRADVRRRVVQHYLLPRMRRYKDAESHLDVLQQSFPEDGSLWQERAICQENLNQYEAAAESLQKATLFPPDQVRSHELLARLLRKYLNRTRQADEVITDMMARHAGSAEAHLARARYRMEFRLGDVSEDAAAAIRIAPDNAEAILLYAHALHEQKKLPEAVAQLERGLKLFPADPRMYRHLAWIEYFSNKRDSARERLQTGIVNCPDAFDLHIALAELLVQGKMFDQVEKIIVELKAKGVREERVGYLTARIAVEREQWPEAVAQLEKVRTESRQFPDLAVQVNVLLAHCHKQLGDRDRELEALRHVLELDAQSVPARLGIAAIYAETNRIGEAIKEYEQLVNLPGAPESAAAEMVRLMIARKQRTPEEKQSWPDIDRLIAGIEKRFPHSVEPLLARSDLLCAQGRVKDAAALLANARSDSKSVRVWMQSAYCAELAEGTGPAVLDEAVKQLGDLPEMRLKRAAILVNRSPLEARAALRDLEKPPAGYTDEQTMQLRTGLAELYFAIQDFGNSRRVFRQLADSRPGDLHARLMLVEIALRENDREALPGLLAEVRKVEPAGGTVLPMLEARQQLALAEEGDHSAAERARGLLQVLQQQRPNWALVRQCLGRLAEADGDKLLAIEHYRSAISLGDSDLHTHHRLIRLLVEAKREKEAEDVLANAARQGTMSVERQRSVLSAAAPMLKSAIVQQYLRQSTSKEATDPGEQVWLGKMMWDTGDHTRAIAAFRSAVAQAGHVPEHWVTLVQALAADQKPDEALKTIEEARRKLPPDLARRTAANCLEVLRRYDAALTEYRAALKEQSGDPLVLRRCVRLLLSSGKPKEAVAILTDTLANPAALAKEDLAWARRNLAILGAAERKPEQYARAMELLKQNEAELGPNLEDMRARVVLLSQQPPMAGEDASPRKRAIELLEKIILNPRSGTEDHFALAKLYDAQRDWPKAEQQYRIVMAADPRNPLPLAHLTRRLLQLGKLPEAAEAVRQLDSLAPGSALAINLRSRLAFQSGDVNRLLADLTSYGSVDAAAPGAGDHAYLAGALLDEFVRSAANPHPEMKSRLREAALTFYERSISSHPEAVVRMVELWSHTGDRKLALAWLRDPRMKIPLNLRASAEIASLRASHVAESESQAVERWLRDEAARSPEVMLDLHMADLAELRHNFPTAESLYRKVLAKDESQVVAMNNLAWVLTLRGPSDEALALVQRAVGMIGPIPDLLDTRAKVFLTMGRAAEAAQDLEDAIAESPTALRYFQLALARERNANPEGAREAFQLAIQYGIDSRDLHPVDLPAFERFKQSNGVKTAGFTPAAPTP